MEKNLMYDRFLQNICVQVENRIVPQIFHEYVCLFEVAALDETINTTAGQVADKLLSSIIELLISKDEEP